MTYTGVANSIELVLEMNWNTNVNWTLFLLNKRLSIWNEIISIYLNAYTLLTNKSILMEL